MPAALDRCVKRLVKEGKSEKSAWAICNAARGKKKKTKKKGKRK